MKQHQEQQNFSFTKKVNSEQMCKKQLQPCIQISYLVSEVKNQSQCV